jgi:glycosyl transferase family 1
LKIYLSIKPKLIGGGNNTFAWNFKKQARMKGHRIVKDIRKADLAIIIAHLAEEQELIEARGSGCKIIHRLDEYFEKNEDVVRKEKHRQIINLNRHTDVTVFQSQFVYNNVYPILKPEKCCIIHNGGDRRKFYASSKPGKYIGHVTWGIDTKKRLDLLHEYIRSHPNYKFLLVGRHRESKYDFNLPNVKLAGKVKRWRLPVYFRKMKFLFFPSEKDPCPNTVVESILSGVPVCYNEIGGTAELVTGHSQPIDISKLIKTIVARDKIESDTDKLCGLPLNMIDKMDKYLSVFRNNCRSRVDLDFNVIFKQYLSVINLD